MWLPSANNLKEGVNNAWSLYLLRPMWSRFTILFWSRVPALKEVASIAKLTADNYDSNRIAEDIINADAQKPSGDMRMGSYEEHAVKQIKESMIIKNELPDEVNTFIEKLQNKTLGVVPVDFYEVANRY